jgi:anti-anti-sigma factor
MLALNCATLNHPCGRMPLLRCRRDTVAASFEMTRDGDVLRLVGELDLANASGFEDAVLAASAEDEAVSIDLAGLTFIDSSGIRALIRIADGCAPRQVILRSPRPNVLKIFEITGFEPATENVTVERA